ncbi:EpsG family protein [Chryseobacterium sp. MFBS3-17]|uniref:EpsG family protein n=1 Tax=Chryseobacterium sp. MFBS3-17 TaxID=2886689 RepID=UPI001D0DF272|nr:EpsG family protein [Chryseobacterium sp. MFBS3-17]MCC2591359.1 EpsG family protein [Chryseobacterium sp. MFBS3-17]
MLISLLFGFLGFLYIPTITNDKAKYFIRFEYFEKISLENFLQYLVLTKRPDFIFETLMYLFAQSKVNIQWLFFIISTFVVYSILTFCNKILEINLIKSKRLLLTPFMVLITIFSLSYSGLLSGVRFYFALSIFIWSIYFLFIDKNRTKGILLLVVTIATHFSFSFFIPAIIITFFFQKKLNLKLILAISLIFLFLPQNILANILGFLEMPETYGNKADAYLNNEVEFSKNSIILTFLRNAWIYFLYVFILFINKDKKDLLTKILVVFTAFVNITYSVPIIFNRYVIVLKVLFLSVIFIRCLHSKNQLKYLYILGILFFINFVVDINVLRYNILASYKMKEMWNIILLITNKISPHDFL